MKLLVEEYFDVLLTIIGGLIIIAIIVSSVISTNIIINHNEKINPVNLHSDRIISFDCKDVVIDIDSYDKVKDKTIKKDDNKDFFEYVVASSYNGNNLIDNVKARIVEDNNKKYVLFILKYCNDYRIKKTKLYIKEDNNENNV